MSGKNEIAEAIREAFCSKDHATGIGEYTINITDALRSIAEALHSIAATLEAMKDQKS